MMSILMLSGGRAKLASRGLGFAVIAALMLAGSGLQSIGVPAWAAAANPAPVLVISNTSHASLRFGHTGAGGVGRSEPLPKGHRRSRRGRRQ